MIALVIPGEAVPFARAGGRGSARYTLDPQRNYMAAVALLAKRAMAGQKPMQGPLFLQARFEYQTPKSWKPAKAAATRFKTSTPDVDNNAKLLCDALKGIVWRDDAQVARLDVQKVYGLKAQTIVTITSLDPREDA